jgi:competence protein ComEA
MNTIRKWIRNIFGFSRVETNGFIILLPLMVVIIMAQPAYRLWESNRSDDFSKEEKYLDSLARLLQHKTEQRGETQTQASLFFFNPNKASIGDLKKLGFTENLSTRIASYRQKGGQFRVKSDLLKIYGIDSTLYHQLYPYIQLPEKGETKDSGVKPQISQHKKILSSFDLNVADTAQLMSVDGIGPTLAARIIKFRNVLGGFIKPEQLNEVYGLDTTVVQKLNQISFINTDFVPVKININTANEKELSAHPYIRKPIAKAIVAYRFQHGVFNQVGDIRKLSLLKQEEADQIIPYLKTAD